MTRSEYPRGREEASHRRRHPKVLGLVVVVVVVVVVACRSRRRGRQTSRACGSEAR